MRFCEGVVPCGTALFAFVRESRAHSITPLGKQDSLNSGGVGAGPHSDQIGIITGFRGINQTGLYSPKIVPLSTKALDEGHFPASLISNVGRIAIRIVSSFNPLLQIGDFLWCSVRNCAEITAHLLPKKSLPAGHNPAPAFWAAARPWRSRMDFPSRETT